MKANLSNFLIFKEGHHHDEKNGKQRSNSETDS